MAASCREPPIMGVRAKLRVGRTNGQPLKGGNAMQRLVVAAVSVALAMALGLGSAIAADKKVLAFVVNGASDFWKIAEAGVKKAQGELPNYDLQFKYPEQAAAAVQQRMMDDLVAAGAAGIMIS